MTTRQPLAATLLWTVLMVAGGMSAGLAQAAPGAPDESSSAGSSSVESAAIEATKVDTATVDAAASETAASASEVSMDSGLLQDTDPLTADEKQWLFEVDPLITAAERALFRSLRRSHQRDAFQREFWKVRDPYPRTVRNELKERWPIRLAEVKSLYGSLTDDRSRLLLTQGPPDSSFQVRCTETRRPVDVWIYRGSDWTDVNTALIFYRRGGLGEARLWRPGYSGPGAEQAIRRVRGCIGGPQMLQVMSYVMQDPQQYDRDLSLLLAKPRPSSTEWVQSFVALSTDLPYDAAHDARLDGWRRGFWQGSPDHRGTPEAPGRVVTLVRDPDSHVWGRVYRVAAGEEARVLERLDVREIAGYERFEVRVHRGSPKLLGHDASAPCSALIYVGNPDNPDWLGP
ncbi:MAG: gamma-glutamylcyclotransferase, partial [Acidobacteriota bacterium]